MKYRKLRIAWSAACAMLCLLLIVLWVRSYWWVDAVTLGALAPMAVQLTSINGLLGATTYAAESGHWGSFSVRRDSYNFDAHRHGQFAYFESGGNWTFIVPHLFLIAVSIAIGSVAWMKRRFNLRTLLIGMTLIAVVSAVIYAVR